MKQLFRLFCLSLLVMVAGIASAQTYTVAGVSAIVNGDSEWAPANTANDMTSVGNNYYKLVVANCTLSAGTNYEYKVVKDHSWDNAWPSSNAILNVNQSGSYTIIFSFNSNTNAVAAIATASVVGSATGSDTGGVSDNLFGTSWNPNSNDMTLQSGGTFQWSKDNVALSQGNMTYKIVANHNWDQGAWPSQNATLTIPADGIYNCVFTFDPVTMAVNASATQCVAQIGDTYYETLQAAINAVPTGGGTATTVTMLSDYSTTPIVLMGGRNVELDLDGHTVTLTAGGRLKVNSETLDFDTSGETTVQGSFFVLGGSTLTVTGNGTITTSNSTFPTICNVGTLVIENGTVTRTAGNASVIVNNYNGQVTISGGTIVNNSNGSSTGHTISNNAGTASNGVMSHPNSKITVNGGSISAANKKNAIDNYGIVEINDGTVTGGPVTDGTIPCAAINSHAAGAIVTINGGNIFAGNDSEYSKCISESTGTITINPNSTFNRDLSSFDGNGHVTINGVFSNNGNGTYTVIEATYVAQIGDKKYTTLANAIADVPTDGTETTITMIADEAVVAGVTVAAGQNIVLELNGKTISGNTDSSTTYALITNKGTLVIQDNTDTNKDGTGTGLITTYISNPDGGDVPGYASNTITNNGNLTVKSGKIVNNGNGYACYAIDNQTNGTSYSPVLKIEGGRMQQMNAYTYAVRMFANSTTNVNTCEVSGGVIEGGYGLWLQTPNANANQASLTITGGTINANDGAAVYIGGTKADNSNISIDISGGTINGTGLIIQGPLSGTYGSVSISDGEIVNVQCGANVEKFITGGIYDNPVNEAYCAEGYIPVDLGNNKYSVKRGAYVAKIGNVKFETLQAAVDAAETGATIDILTDINLITVTTEPNNKYNVNINKSVTINGNNYTITSSEGKRALALTGEGNEIILKDLTVVNNKADWCVGVLNNLTCTLDNTTLDGSGFSGSYNQPLTIGGISESGRVTLNVTNGSVIKTNDEGTAHYAIIAWHPADITVTDSKLIGWANIYLKPDAAGSTVTVSGSEMESKGISGSSNNFAVIVTESGNNSITITDTKITTSPAANTYQSLFSLNGSGNVVKILGSTTYETTDMNYGAVTFNTSSLMNNNVYFDETTKTAFAEYFDGSNYVTIADEKDASVNLYPLTYEPEVRYYWATETGYQGGYYGFNDPFENGWLDNGEFIALQKNITLTKDITCALTDGQSFNLLLGDYTITKGDYSVALNNGVSVNTDKQTDIFTAVDPLYKVVETANTEGDYAYTYTLALKEFVAQIGETQYESLAEAVAAVPTDGTETTIVMIANETIEGNAGVTIPADKNIILDLNGKTITGVVQNPSSAQTILNKGTLVITDNSADKNGTITNVVSDENAGSPGDDKNWFSNAITNNGTLTVNAGNIVNTGTGGACYAIDNITNGTSCTPVLNIAGGNISAKKVAVRMYCNSTTNDNTVNVTGGVISSENAYAIQAQQANNNANKAILNISGGTLSGQYAFCDYGNKNVATQFDNTSYNITGGFFTGYMWSYATYYCGMDGFVSGGYFSNEIGGDLVTPGYACVENTDEATNVTYPYAIGPADIHYYWLDNNGNIDGGGYYTIYAPFAGPDPVLMDGEFIELQRNITLTKDITYIQEVSFGDPIFKGGTFTLKFGEYDIDLNGFKFPIPVGVTILTDKQTTIFSAIEADYKVVELTTETGYSYTIVAKNYVAQIGEGENVVQYETLAAAIADVQEGETIVMIAEATETAGIDISNKTFTLDLNGQVVNLSADDAFTGSGANWTIKDSSDTEKNGTGTGKINATGQYEIADVSNSTITVESGLLESSGRYGIFYSTNCTVNVTGGKMVDTHDANKYMLTVAGANGVLNFSGGSMYHDAGSGIQLLSGSKANISDEAYISCKKSTIILYESAESEVGKTLNVTGGTIVSTNGTAISTNGTRACENEINISGGEITGYYAAIYNPNASTTVTISDGTLTGGTGIAVKGGTVNISGGTITANGAFGEAGAASSGYKDTGDAIYVEDTYGTAYHPTVNITGGTISSTNGYTAQYYTNMTNAAEATGSINISDGVLIGNSKDALNAIIPEGLDKQAISVSGGWFSSVVPEDYCAESVRSDSEPHADAPNEAAPYTVKEPTYVAQIGDVKYETLQAAVDDAQEGDVIDILTNINLTTVTTEPNNKYNVNINKSVTINGNNYTITSSEGKRALALTGEGNEIILKDLTVVNNKADWCVGVLNNLTCTLDNTTLDGSGFSGSYNQPLTIGGISESGRVTLNVTNGSVIKTNDEGTAHYAIIAWHPADITVTDSKLIGWANIYLKPDAAGSTVTVSGSEMESKGISGSSNNFAVIVTESGNNSITITDTKITTSPAADTYQCLFSLSGSDNTLKFLGSTTYETSDMNYGAATYNWTSILNNDVYFDDTSKAAFEQYFDGSHNATIKDEVDETGLYPVTFEPEVLYYWDNGQGGFSGNYYNFAEPFTNGWLDNGEYIALQKDITLSADIACQLTDGNSFNFLQGDYAVTKGDYSVSLNEGVSVYTDKQTDIFTAADNTCMVKEEALTDGGDYSYKYTVVTKESEGIYELIHGEPYPYPEGSGNELATKITYTRTFAADEVNKYRCWYVPFDYTLQAEDVENFDFYKVHMIAASGNETGGEVDNNTMVYLYIEKLDAGNKLTGNRPYVIRPKNEETHVFTVENTKLLAENNGSCHHVETSEFYYDFYGTYRQYQASAGYEFVTINKKNQMQWNATSNAKLLSYVWYIKITSRNDDYAKPNLFIVEGDDLNDITGINSDQLIDDENIEGFYTVDGAKVEKPVKGVTIVRFTNGKTKKIFIK